MATNSIHPKLDALVQKVRDLEQRLGSIECLTQTAAGETSQIAEQMIAVKSDIQAVVRPGWKQRLFRILTSSPAALATFLGIYGSLYLFRFDTSVDAYGTLNPKNPFETRFVISNDSPYSIYNVHYACTISNVRTLDGPNPLANGPGVAVDTSEIRELNSHAKRSLYCGYPFGNGEKVLADTILEIEISYRPFSWMGFSRTHTFPFGLRRTESGDALWLPLENRPDPTPKH